MGKDCSHVLEQVEQGRCSDQSLSTLQMYEERLGGEFSTPHFQAVKAKACAMGSRASGAVRVWNAAWVQCQEIRRRLKEMQKKKKNIDKSQIQQTTAANTQGEHGEIEKEEKGSVIAEAEQSLTPQLSTSAAYFNHHDFKESKEKDSKELQLPEMPDKNVENTSDFPQVSNCLQESKFRPREHHSETDLSNVSATKGADELPLHQPLSRSRSEGSRVNPLLTSFPGFSPSSVGHKLCHSKTQSLEQNQQGIQNVPFSHNKRLWAGNLIRNSERDSNEGKGEGCMDSTQSPEDVRAPETLLTPTEFNGSNTM